VKEALSLATNGSLSRGAESQEIATMRSREHLILRTLPITLISLKFFARTTLAALVVLQAASLVAQAARPAGPQTAQGCIEDFTSDTDPLMPGLASSVFSHSISGSFILSAGFPGDPSGHSLGLFAGAIDVITFPSQSLTYAKVPFFSFSSGIIIFEGVTGNMLTTRFTPAPVVQFREAFDTTLGDNNLPLGQIQKVTLIGFETLFDNIEISPCVSLPALDEVDVLVKPGPNNPSRDGLIKAVILSTSNFDAATVDPATVRFGAATVPFRYFLGDEDEDGDVDLIFFYLFRDVGVRCGDTSVRLTGRTTSGGQIEGNGPITTPGCP
jgi:hypothetical protein